MYEAVSSAHCVELNANMFVSNVLERTQNQEGCLGTGHTFLLRVQY